MRRSALAGALFVLVETAAIGVLFIVTFLLDGVGALGLLLIFAVGAVFVLPSAALVGVIFGLVNGAIVRSRWGRGWLAVGFVTAITATVYVLLLLDSGDPGPTLGLAAVPAAARGLHLRYEQRQARRLLLAVAPQTRPAHRDDALGG